MREDKKRAIQEERDKETARRENRGATIRTRYGDILYQLSDRGRLTEDSTELAQLAIFREIYKNDMQQEILR